MPLSLAGESYGLVDVWDPGARLPAAGRVLWFSLWTWAPGVLLMGTLFPLLFPDGRLVAAQWWPAGAAACATPLVAALGWALPPRSVHEADMPGVLPAGYTLPAPAFPRCGRRTARPVPRAGARGRRAGVVSLVVQYRRGAGRPEGRQVKSVMVAALAVVPMLAAGIAGSSLAPVLNAVATLLFHVAVALAVVGNGLGDIDVVLSRSLVFGVLTTATLAVYGLSAAALGGLFGLGGGRPGAGHRAGRHRRAARPRVGPAPGQRVRVRCPA